MALVISAGPPSALLLVFIVGDVWEFLGFCHQLICCQDFICFRPAVAQKSPAVGKKFVAL